MRFCGVVVEDVVEDVEDAVGEEDVLLQDAGGVDKERVGGEGDGEFAALAGLQLSAVGEVGAVADGMAAIDDVVVEDVGEFGGGHGGEGGAEGLEGVVVGGEDGEVGGGVEVVREGGVGDGAAEGGKVELRGCVDDVYWGLEESVDYVDDTATEFEVLKQQH